MNPSRILLFLHGSRLCVPTFRKGNVVLSALRYVKDVDDFQDKIDRETPEKQLATKLMEAIAERKELLQLLSLFHGELARIGITPESKHHEPTLALIWRYRIAYLTKLARVHNIFWDSCQQEGLSERSHKLGFHPKHIGVLDPIHYKEHYEQLQLGQLGEVVFRDVEVIGKGLISK